MKNVTRYILMMLVFYLTLPMTAALSQALKAEDIRAMVSDKSWRMQASVVTRKATYWDWNRDGTVCARLLSAAKGDACADKGPWRLDGDYLCWELTWFGHGQGLKKQCITIQRSSKGGFEAQRRRLPGMEFFEFTVID